MAVKLRLQRFGSNKRPFYRVVASDSRKPRDGKFLEILGTYDPLLGKVAVDSEKVQKWLGNGAQPTDTVRSLFKKYSVLDK
ncbi:30S ribosomal protein S16 [Peloplasma aerotolerans]|jgi:small subunit ribosomal protein S16|uniref:Small ribosomal subunit protein bS16 n=1 Tax=Peloplasma aerotolerans TaxID=3044389 RepID=A0AAW6U4Y7_9MOLU|nr:30S ribosomal protein S16 [Mariniplasma sp. M4Ah]MDI6452925.1 30S ribosomal protein S16 [Mariniplasma sp. M4Ah]MDR4968313.1 30S ribosomal protein S16 [Acholeplasmataceae bacterium]